MIKIYVLIVCLVLVGILCKKLLPKVNIKKYTQICLYIAVMDDEIARNELDGNFIGEKEIKFPPKIESLQYRYHMFLKLYKEYTIEELENEILIHEERLEESKQFIGMEKQRIDVELV